MVPKNGVGIGFFEECPPLFWDMPSGKAAPIEDPDGCNECTGPASKMPDRDGTLGRSDGFRV